MTGKELSILVAVIATIIVGVIFLCIYIMSRKEKRYQLRLIQIRQKILQDRDAISTFKGSYSFQDFFSTMRSVEDWLPQHNAGPDPYDKRYPAFSVKNYSSGISSLL